MANSKPRDHHHAPQFYMRNFAVDLERRKIATVAKNGHVAVWSQRSIESIGCERGFYVHSRDGAPVSIETAINRRLETPISASETWRKVSSGQTEALDHTDRPILYALIRHLSRSETGFRGHIEGKWNQTLPLARPTPHLRVMVGSGWRRHLPFEQGSGPFHAPNERTIRPPSHRRFARRIAKLGTKAVTGASD